MYFEIKNFNYVFTFLKYNRIQLVSPNSSVARCGYVQPITLRTE